MPVLHRRSPIRVSCMAATSPLVNSAPWIPAADTLGKLRRVGANDYFIRPITFRSAPIVTTSSLRKVSSSCPARKALVKPFLLRKSSHAGVPAGLRCRLDQRPLHRFGNVFRRGQALPGARRHPLDPQFLQRRHVGELVGPGLAEDRQSPQLGLGAAVRQDLHLREDAAADMAAEDRRQLLRAASEMDDVKLGGRLLVQCLGGEVCEGAPNPPSPA